MIFYLTGIILALASLIFSSLPALVIGLIVVAIGMIGEA